MTTLGESNSCKCKFCVFREYSSSKTRKLRGTARLLKGGLTDAPNFEASRLQIFNQEE